MSADRKKSLVKFYLGLTLICLILIFLVYIVDIFVIKPEKIVIGPDNLWYDYIKDSLFGIFTGVLTGFAISFYEYKQQVYFDLYSYIKQTKSCINNVQNMLVGKNYGLCVSQITQYQDAIKEVVVIRKLKKNNELILSLAENIKQTISKLYTEVNTLHNEANTIHLYYKQFEDINKELIKKGNEAGADIDCKKLFLEAQEKRQNLKRTINIHEENLKARTENCMPILNEIEQASQELYDFLSSSRSIFVV